jgi:two-component system response regulator LytT
MTNIIIVEDEPHAAAHLTKRVEQLDCNVVAVFSQYHELLQWISDNEKSDVDILLLDIHVSDGNSFDLFQSGVELPQVILTTAYPDYAIKAFEANCCDYLLKPFSDQRLSQAIAKAKKQVDNDSGKALSYQKSNAKHFSSRQRIMAKRGANIYPIKTDIISYFYKGPLLQLVTQENEKYVHDTTLDELMQCLNPEKFFRINRQWIVNIEAVITIKSHQQKNLMLTLSPNIEQAVIVSQDKVKAFKEWLSAS